MLRTSQMLKRWAAQFPGTRMPDDINDITLGQRDELMRKDPELHDLLAGKATAELELAAIDGSFADSYEAPSQAHLNAAEVDKLIADGAFPRDGYYEGEKYIEPHPGNLTAQMRIAQLDPQRYEAEMLRAKPPAPVPGAITEEEAARINARLTSLNATHGGY